MFNNKNTPVAVECTKNTLNTPQKYRLSLNGQWLVWPKFLLHITTKESSELVRWPVFSERQWKTKFLHSWHSPQQLQDSFLVSVPYLDTHSSHTSLSLPSITPESVEWIIVGNMKWHTLLFYYHCFWWSTPNHFPIRSCKAASAVL